MKLFYLLIYLSSFIIFISDTYGQRFVELNEVIRFSTKGDDPDGYVIYMLPKSIAKKQKLTDIHYSAEPHSVYKENGTHYARWNFRDFNKKDSIVIKTKVLLDRYDLNLVRYNSKEFTSRNIRRHTRMKQNNDALAKFLELDDNMLKYEEALREMAAKLKGGEEEKTVKNIFQFVMNHLEYEIVENEKRGIRKALKRRRGDCSEYSELMVALCRIHNIPARVVTGKTIQGDGTLEAHNWVEVFLLAYGWVPFDPTHADGVNENTTFEKMENKYIYYSHQRQRYIISWSYGENSRQAPKVSVTKNWQHVMQAVFDRAYYFYDQKEDAEAVAALDTLISITTFDYRFHMFKGVLYARKGDFKKALSCLQFAMKNTYFDIEKANVLYAFANYYALQNNLERSLSHLGRAVELGFYDFNHIKKDEDLASIKDDAGYQNLLIKYHRLNELIFKNANFAEKRP